MNYIELVDAVKEKLRLIKNSETDLDAVEKECSNLEDICSGLELLNGKNEDQCSAFLYFLCREYRYATACLFVRKENSFIPYRHSGKKIYIRNLKEFLGRTYMLVEENSFYSSPSDTGTGRGMMCFQYIHGSPDYVLGAISNSSFINEDLFIKTAKTLGHFLKTGFPCLSLELDIYTSAWNNAKNVLEEMLSDFSSISISFWLAESVNTVFRNSGIYSQGEIYDRIFADIENLYEKNYPVFMLSPGIILSAVPSSVRDQKKEENLVFAKNSLIITHRLMNFEISSAKELELLKVKAEKYVSKNLF